MPLRSRRPDQLGYSIRPQMGAVAVLGFLVVGLLPTLLLVLALGSLTGLLTVPLPTVALPTASWSAPASTATAVAPATLQPTPGARTDQALADGHFYTQGGTPGSGFAVQDRDGIAFWSTFRQLGGSEQLGYPISHRFAWRGFILQAFERGVLQGLPGSEVQVLNLMDELSSAGLDGWLRARYNIPTPIVDPPGRSAADVFANRLALLDADAEIKAFWQGLNDPIKLFGLPTSKVEDSADFVTLRAQRSVIRRWKASRPGGPVAALDVGRIAAEATLFPPEAFLPEALPTRSAAGR